VATGEWFYPAKYKWDRCYKAWTSFHTMSCKSPFSNFKETISMRNPEVQGKFVFTVYVWFCCPVLAWRPWTCTAFLFIICESFFELTCFNFIKAQKKEKIIFKTHLYNLNLFHSKVRVISRRVYRQKPVIFNEHLKTFYEAFRVEFHIIIKPIESKITYLLYIYVRNR
jgi:hypothetical protein